MYQYRLVISPILRAFVKLPVINVAKSLSMHVAAGGNKARSRQRPLRPAHAADPFIRNQTRPTARRRGRYLLRVKQVHVVSRSCVAGS